MQAKRHLSSAELLIGPILLNAMKAVLRVTDGETPIVPPFEQGGYAIEHGNFDADRLSGVLKNLTCKLKRGSEKINKSPYFQPEVTITLAPELVEKAVAEFIIENDLEEIGLNKNLYKHTDFSFKWSPLGMNAVDAAKEMDKILVTAYYPIKTERKVENNVKIEEQISNGKHEFASA